MARPTRLRHYLDSLTGRMALGLLAIHLVLIPVLFVGVFYLVKQGYQEQFVQYARSDAAAFARDLASMSPRGARLQALLDEAFLDSRLVFVEVVDGGGQRLAAAGNVPGAFVEDFFFGQHDDRTYHVALPLGADGALGTVLRGYDETPTREQIGLVYRRGAYLALAYVLLTFGVVAFVGLKLTHPLRRLIEATDAIAAGAYDRRVDMRSRDEIGELGATFNRMAAAVEERTRRLTAFNHVAAAMTAHVELKELLEQVMYFGTDLGESQAACIAFYDEKTGRFKEWITHGLSEHFVKNMAFQPGGLADETFTTGTYVLSDDRSETKHKLSKLTYEEGIRSFICLPLTSRDCRLGVVYFYRKTRDTFDADDIALLQTFAHLAAGAIENARLYAQVQEQARTDALTGLNNRREFQRQLKEEEERSRRFNRPLSLLLLDIDHFKHVNDTHGHLAGDAVLRGLGELLRREARAIDRVCRYGGEEITVILPETGLDAAANIAERMRAAVEAQAFDANSEPIRMTVSIGVASWPEQADSAEALVAAADTAMYAAKQGGRNRVVRYEPALAQSATPE